MKNIESLRKLCMAALFAALCYIGFTYCKIDIPAGGEKTAFHLGNVFCVLAALILGGLWGGLAGAVGMTIGDLLDPVYITSAPKTFLLKLCIGVITGFVAHRVLQLRQKNEPFFAICPHLGQILIFFITFGPKPNGSRFRKWISCVIFRSPLPRTRVYARRRDH